MKIIRPYAKLTMLGGHSFYQDSPDSAALFQVEAAARVSHRSEAEQSETTTERFINAVVLKHGDWSVVEHVTATVEFLVDRGVTHEIVRHRLFSYTQESTRFVNYAKRMPPSFVYPIVKDGIPVECNMCLSEVNDGPLPIDESMNAQHCEPWVHGLDDQKCAYEPAWLCSIRHAEDEYRNLLDIGWRPQEARSVFPNALASKLIMTGNLRCWRHFFQMRTTVEAHPQMRQVTIPLLAQFKQAVPLIFDDLQPDARQIDNLKLPC